MTHNQKDDIVLCRNDPSTRSLALGELFKDVSSSLNNSNNSNSNSNLPSILLKMIQGQLDDIVNKPNNENLLLEIDWFRDILLKSFTYFTTDTKDKKSKKLFLSSLVKSTFKSIDDIRLKYKSNSIINSNNNITPDNSSNNNNNNEKNNSQGIMNNSQNKKLIDYELQVILRLEYMIYLFQSSIAFKKSNNSNSNSNNNSNNIYDKEYCNSLLSTPLINAIVSLLQDISFILDSRNSGNFVDFLDTVLVYKYLHSLPYTLSKIYKLLEISKPHSLKQYLKQINKQPTPTKLNNNNNVNEKKKSIPMTPIENGDENDNTSKKQKLDSKSTTTTSTPTPTPEQEAQSLLGIKRVNARRLGHFNMNLSDPKAFKTFKTTTN
ncbi:hypothetical protein CYY_001207 [Polysphondylium violaceum]|uniref:Uncharacterized protein n=1 Tax=Polysphondylium violaceum TaxID=133409 RepID=A0A8J4PYK5_9MYCE|nr:hypothetical protein CYY_001207 [Polysphondylium violaceum]